MSIVDLSDFPKVIKKKKRLGRGYSSGTGKTCGKGHKGQKSRAGVSTDTLYAKTGQTPMFRQLPRRGCSSLAQILGKSITIISVERLAGLIESGKLTDNIKKSDLVKVGIISNESELIKLLGGVNACSKFQVEVDFASKGAKNRLENNGGKVSIVPKVKK